MKSYFTYRKSIYASLSAYIGIILNLQKSRLLIITEREQLGIVLKEIRTLHSMIKATNQSIIEKAKNKKQ